MAMLAKLASISLLIVLLLLTMAGCSQPGGAASANGGGRGHELYQLHCLECHEGGNLNLRKQPPKLAGLFHGKNLPSGAPATDQEVRKTIIEGRGIMPAFDQRLSDRDLEDLIRYLHSI